MEKQKNVQVAEKNSGTKINWEQNGCKIIFGDDELSIRCDTRQRDWPVHMDVCMDNDNNLVIGVGAGRYYVAQIDIPPIEYVESEAEGADVQTMAETMEEAGVPGGQFHNIQREAKPLDMGDVVLTLWSMDDLKPAVKQ